VDFLPFFSVFRDPFLRSQACGTPGDELLTPSPQPFFFLLEVDAI